MDRLEAINEEAFEAIDVLQQALFAIHCNDIALTASSTRQDWQLSSKASDEDNPDLMVLEILENEREGKIDHFQEAVENCGLIALPDIWRRNYPEAAKNLRFYDARVRNLNQLVESQETCSGYMLAFGGLAVSMACEDWMWRNRPFEHLARRQNDLKISDGEVIPFLKADNLRLFDLTMEMFDGAADDRRIKMKRAQSRDTQNVVDLNTRRRGRKDVFSAATETFEYKMPKNCQRAVARYFLSDRHPTAYNSAHNLRLPAMFQTPPGRHWKNTL